MMYIFWAWELGSEVMQNLEDIWSLLPLAAWLGVSVMSLSVIHYNPSSNEFGQSNPDF
jgi:hypothetical protein